MKDELDELEFRKCMIALLSFVIGFVIILQFFILFKIGEVRKEQSEHHALTSALIDYTLKTSEQIIDKE